MRPALRTLAEIGLGAADRVPPISRGLRRGLAVFTFHDVGDHPSPFQAAHALTTPTALFERQLDWITASWTVVPAAALLEDRPLPPAAAVLTFDDGWAGTFEEGLPRLAARGLPSIVFLTGAPLLGAPDPTVLLASRSGGAASRDLLLPTPATLPDADAWPVGEAGELLRRHQGRYADWSLVEAWDGRSGVAWGSHLFRHWLVAALDDAELTGEYRRNEELLAGLRASLPLFAFPFGRPAAHFLPGQVELLRQLGAARVFTSLPRVNRDTRRFVLDRIALTPADWSPAALLRLLAIGPLGRLGT